MSPRHPSRVEHFGALIGRARGSHHVVISVAKALLRLGLGLGLGLELGLRLGIGEG